MLEPNHHGYQGVGTLCRSFNQCAYAEANHEEILEKSRGDYVS